MKRKRQTDDIVRNLTAVILCIAVITIMLVGAFFIVYDYSDLLPPGNEPRELPYEQEVYSASEKYDIEPARIYAVIHVESSFREEVISKAGAIGLMQMMPDTYKELCEKRGCAYDPEDLKDPAVNIDFCTEYLKYLYDSTGDWTLAHLAYNVGIGNVRRWLKNENYSADGKSFHTIPSKAGRTYVERIDNAYAEYFETINE